MRKLPWLRISCHARGRMSLVLGQLILHASLENFNEKFISRPSWLSAFGPEMQISSVQGNSLFPERDEETGCTGGAVITSVSRMAWMNLPGLQMASGEPASLPTCALLSGYGEWAEMGTDVPHMCWPWTGIFLLHRHSSLEKY